MLEKLVCEQNLFVHEKSAVSIDFVSVLIRRSSLFYKLSLSYLITIVIVLISKYFHSRNEM